MAYRDTPLGVLVRTDRKEAARLICEALEQCDGNVTHAARALKVHVNTLRRWILSLEVGKGGRPIKRRGPGKPAKQGELGG